MFLSQLVYYGRLGHPHAELGLLCAPGPHHRATDQVGRHPAEARLEAHARGPRQRVQERPEPAAYRHPELPVEPDGATYNENELRALAEKQPNDIASSPSPTKYTGSSTTRASTFRSAASILRERSSAVASRNGAAPEGGAWAVAARSAEPGSVLSQDAPTRPAARAGTAGRLLPLPRFLAGAPGPDRARYHR
jgi:hypothetical protein